MSNIEIGTTKSEKDLGVSFNSSFESKKNIGINDMKHRIQRK